MMRLLKFLLTYKLKTSQTSHKNSGFTLIELLVGLVLAFLVITPLLGFVVNMMQTDRQEQAKATSEQEIQAALEYIARDLDQSFFIYDALGLAQIKNKLPTVANAFSADAEGEPVLVFWKRQFLPKALPVRNSNIGECQNDPKKCSDGFVYSLVAYYQITDRTCGSSTWSCTTRIGRVEMRDTLYDVNNRPREAVSDEYKKTPGFIPIDKLFANSGSLETQFNDWTKVTPEAGNPKGQILIDYIDQTTLPADPNTPPLGPACSEATRPNGAPRPDNQNYPNNYIYRQVPIYKAGAGAVDDKFKTGSFYACVDTDRTVAQVFIRGNALARIRQKSNPPAYVPTRSAYFPSASIQAQGRGLLNAKQSGS